MQTSLTNFLATDNVQLPGLLFEPDAPTRRAAAWLHGMGDNGVFYKSDLINELALALNGQGIALLAFNNRGAHNRKTLKIVDETLPEDEQRLLAGTHHELIADCVHDIDGAAGVLQQAGYTELFLLGHSTGANKVCAYDSLTRNNPFSRYVLSGPGDDCGLWHQGLGAKRFKQTLELAQRWVHEGKPHKIMPKYTGMHPFSAQSAADILNPDGLYNCFPYYEATTQRLGTKPLFAELSKIRTPFLAICGSEDEAMQTAGSPAKGLELIAGYTHADVAAACTYEQVEGADHSFNGYERVFAEGVAAWLSR